MATYRVVFVNGEKREMVVEADELGVVNGSYNFKNNNIIVAATPIDRVLFIKAIEKPE